MVCLLCFSGSLLGNVTIAVNGEAQDTPLTPGEGSWKAASSTWAKQRGKFHLTVNPPYVTSEWEENDFSFTPGADGRIRLILTGIWRTGADRKPIRYWAGYRNIVITGAEFANDTFEAPRKGNDKEKRWNFLEKDGVKYIAACSTNQVSRTLKVHQGQKVRVSLEACRIAEMENYDPDAGRSCFTVGHRVNAVPQRAFLLPGKGGPEVWSAPVKQSAKPEAEMKLRFDDRNLYIRIVGEDGEFNQPFKDQEAWKGSGVRVAMDFLGNLAWRYDPKDKGDYELGFSYRQGREQLHPYVFHTDYPLAISDIVYRFSGEKEPRQIYDIAIPWQAVPASDYGTLSWFGFDYQLTHSVHRVQRKLFQPADYRIAVLDKSGTGIGAMLLPPGRKSFKRDEPAKAQVYLLAEKKGTAILTLKSGKNTTVWNDEYFPGENILGISIDGSRLQDGVNSIRVELEIGGRKILRETMELTVLNPVRMAADLQRNLRIGKEKAAELRRKLAPYEGKELRPWIQIGTARIAELFLERYIPEDLGEKRLDMALRESNEVNELLDQALEDFKTGRLKLSRRLSAEGAALKDGRIVDAEGRDIFLFTHHYISQLTHLDARAWEELGVNFTESCSGPYNHMQPPDKKDDPLPLPYYRRRVRKLARLEDRPYTAVNLLLHQFIPQWFTRMYPEAKVAGNGFFPLDPDHPRVKELVNKSVGWQFGRLAGPDAERARKILFYDLHNEPGFSTVTDYTLINFRNYLKGRYGSLQKLNRIWGTDYGSFEEIGKPHGLFAKIPVTRHDWTEFNNLRFYNHFAGMRKAILDNAGDTKFNLTFKVTNFSSWTPVYQDRGYDRELLMGLTEVQGGDIWDANRVFGPYSFQWRVQSMTLDLCRSIAPEQPIVDSEYHMFTYGYDQMHCCVTAGAYHGLNGTSLWCSARSKTIWFWKPGARESGMTHFIDSVDTKPGAFAGYTHAGAKIQQQAATLPLFYKGDRPVCIYYSQPTLNYEPTRYLAPLEAAYQAFYFQGVQLGFVTERMLLADRIVPTGVKLLIVPDARYCNPQVREKFRQLEASGVSILLIGEENLKYDTFNQEIRKPLNLRNPICWKLPPNYAASYGAVSLPPAAWITDAPKALAQAGIRPMAVPAGSNTAFVEMRFARNPQTGRTVGYALNLGRETASFRLENPLKPGQSLRFRDTEYQNGPALDSITLKPMQNFNFEFLPER